MSRSLVKLTEIGTKWWRGVTVTQKPINTNVKGFFLYNYSYCVELNLCMNIHEGKT